MSLEFVFHVGFCAVGLFWEEAKEIQKGWVGWGGVEKLNQIAGCFWKESVQRNAISLLAAMLASGHCLS